MGIAAAVSDAKSPARERLEQLAGEQSTGELIFVGDGAEIRLYLERGLVVWGSSNNSRTLFAKSLEESAGITKKSIGEAVKECRRTKRAVGEYLVDHFLASEAQVEAALRAQILGAFRDLQVVQESVQGLFIPRGEEPERYQKIAFDADEMWGEASENTTTLELERSFERIQEVSQIDLSPLSQCSGYIASALVDRETGLVMSEHGRAPFPMALAAAGNTEMVRAKLTAMQSLGLSDKIEDFVISLGTQYHIIRVMDAQDNIFIYMVLDRDQANLGMARFIIRDFEKKAAVSS